MSTQSHGTQIGDFWLSGDLKSDPSRNPPRAVTKILILDPESFKPPSEDKTKSEYHKIIRVYALKRLGSSIKDFENQIGAKKYSLVKPDITSLLLDIEYERGKSFSNL